MNGCDRVYYCVCGNVIGSYLVLLVSLTVTLQERRDTRGQNNKSATGFIS